MNWLTIKTRWSGLELGMIKVCVGSLYLILGTLFHDFFQNYLSSLLGVFILSFAATLYLWFTKLKEARSDSGK